MNQIARVVNVFSTPYEAWSYRQSTDEEALSLCQKGYSLAESFTTKDKLLEEVSNHVQAAARMLREGADNALERHIDKALSASSEYRDLRNLMPSNVPQALSAYQAEFSEAVWEIGGRGCHRRICVIQALDVDAAEPGADGPDCEEDEALSQ